LRGIIALIGLLGEKGKVEEVAKRGEDPGGRVAGQRKGEGCGMEGDDTWGKVSAVQRKEKRRWGSGLPRERKLGRPGHNEGEVLFLFSFSFSNFFLIEPFQLKFNQNFSNFFTKFYKPFKPHTSNQKPCIAK
jgi:hypothetical protein